MYKIYETTSGNTGIAYNSDGVYFSFQLSDRNEQHYINFLDYLNSFGVESIEGEIPSDILSDAAQRLFSQKLKNYSNAMLRLSRYELSKGCQQSVKTVPGPFKEMNVDTMQMESILIEQVEPAIEPLESTIEVWETVEGSSEPVKKTIRNPLIVQDELERAAAQLIIDNTPQDVKDNYAALNQSNTE